MNVPYPGFSTKIGFDLSIVIMALAAVILYFVFKKKDWL
jgi:Mg2+ and Co2+ transporter CorA